MLTEYFKMTSFQLNPALFLDRDGVINREVGHISTISKIEFSEDIFELCRFFKNKFFKIIIITNQSGIGRGMISIDQYDKINEYIFDKFKFEKCDIDLIKTSFMDPRQQNPSQNEIFRRKPNPGLILESELQLNLDLTKSLLIGDNLTDMQAGRSAGIPRLYLIGKPSIHSDYFESFIDVKSCLKRLKNVF